MDKIDVKCKIVNFDFPDECESAGTKLTTGKRTGYFTSTSKISKNIDSKEKEKNFFVFGKNSKQKEFKSKKLNENETYNLNSSPKKLIMNTRYDLPLDNLENFGNISKITNDNGDNLECPKNFMNKEISIGLNISNKFLSLDNKIKSDVEKRNRDKSYDVKSINKSRPNSTKFFKKHSKNLKTLSKPVKNQLNTLNKQEIYGEK